MSCGNVTITIPAGVLNAHQMEQLREDLSFHDHTDMTPGQLHIIRSKVEAYFRASGALEMPSPIDVKYCEPDAGTETLILHSKVEAHTKATNAPEMPSPMDLEGSEPEAATETLLLLVERQIMLEDGTWTPWQEVNLNNPAMELKSGQRVRQRVRTAWNSGRLEGKVVEFQV